MSKGFQNNFLKHCEDAGWQLDSNRVLLAVSGGIDSVVMCHLFAFAKFDFAVAHVNYQLRGADSDDDELFVKNLAIHYRVPFYSTKVDTQRIAEASSESVQMVARRLRYNWFSELLAKHKFRYIATAHHLNDSVETVLLNMSRGTGLSGLSGIPLQNGKIIRPLLFASRNQIVEYASEKALSFREDVSNSSDKYQRNFVRHHIVPAFTELNPSFLHTMQHNMSIWSEVAKWYTGKINRLSKQLIHQRGEDLYMSIALIKNNRYAKALLYENLKQYGFTSAQVNDVIEAIEAHPGKQFIAGEFRLIRDRRFFILTKTSNSASYHLVTPDCDLKVDAEKLFRFSLHSAEDISITADAKAAYINADSLTYPLTLRVWKQGDYFYPFGMNRKKKKVKKLLTDLKVPLHEKERVWVVECEQKILWVCGIRSDERFRVTASTKKVLKIEMI